MATIALLCILFMIFILLIPIAEHAENPPGLRPWIRLYEGFYQNKLYLNFESKQPLYVRKMFKINLKSVDIFIPLLGDGLDNIRSVKIWSIYPDSLVASSESDFYNPYTEPDFARRANTAKYKLILDVRAGQRVLQDITEPVKKIFIYARC